MAFRHFVGLIGFWCMSLVGFNANIFDAHVVKMINNQNISEELVQVVSGGYYLGYILQVPAGILASKFGGHIPGAVGMLISIILSFGIPFIFGNWKLLLVCRVWQGFGATVALPSMVALYTRWTPRLNKTRMFCRGIAGLILGILLADFTKDSMSTATAGDMVIVCQVYGAVGMLWFILWTIFITSDPDRNSWTSLSEKEYIAFHRLPARSPRHLGSWVWLITAPKAWAIYIPHVCLSVSCCMLYIGYSKLYKHIDPDTMYDPIYLDRMPNPISCLIAGIIADVLIAHYTNHITTIRKAITGVGMVIPGILCIVLATVDLGDIGYMGIAVVQGVMMGLVFGGFMAGYMDLTVNLAPVMISIGSTLATISTLAIPFLLHRFEKSRNGIFSNVNTGWRSLFIGSGGTLLFGATIYCIFGSGDRYQDGGNVYEEIQGTRTDSRAEATTHRVTSQQDTSQDPGPSQQDTSQDPGPSQQDTSQDAGPSQQDTSQQPVDLYVVEQGTSQDHVPIQQEANQQEANQQPVDLYVVEQRASQDHVPIHQLQGTSRDLDPEPSHQQISQDPEPSHQQPSQDPESSHQQTSQDPEPSHQQTSLDPESSHQQTSQDPEPSLQQTSRDPEPSQQQTSRDPEPSHQQTSQDPEPSHQQTSQDPEPSHQQTSQDPEPSHQQTSQDPELSHQQTSQDPEPSHQQTSQDPESSHQQTSQDPGYESEQRSSKRGDGDRTEVENDNPTKSITDSEKGTEDQETTPSNIRGPNETEAVSALLGTEQSDITSTDPAVQDPDSGFHGKPGSQHTTTQNEQDISRTDGSNKWDQISLRF